MNEYQMSITEIMSGEVDAIIRLHPSGKYKTFVCPFCNHPLGMYDIENEEYLFKKECSNGHKVKGFRLERSEE